MVQLRTLCRESRNYEIERWIADGRAIQLEPEAVPKGRHLETPLEIAIERGNHALVLLLLCNGYDPNRDKISPLERAVEGRRWPIVDLLWEWGADPRRVYAYDILVTYNSELMERFYRAGTDLTENHEMAAVLGAHTSNRPLFGFARRHCEHDPKIQRELNMALAESVERENERGVALCLWAGADPHAPVPLPGLESAGDDDAEPEEDRFEGWSAIHQAATQGRVEMLKRLGPDPTRDDFESMYQWASSGDAVGLLASISPPKDVGAILRNQLFYLCYKFPRHQNPLGVVAQVFKSGARWADATAEEVAGIRRGILKTDDSDFVSLMKLLALDDHCNPTILRELTRTPSMRERMRKVGLIPWQEPPRRRYGYQPDRPTRAREVARNCGFLEPKAPRHVPAVVEVRSSHAPSPRVSLDREALYDRVWSEPVDRLAKSWGLTGRGLGKLCARLRIPVPPRGYWARVQHGQRVPRTPLPKTSEGLPKVTIRLD